MNNSPPTFFQKLVLSSKRLPFTLNSSATQVAGEFFFLEHLTPHQ